MFLYTTMLHLSDSSNYQQSNVLNAGQCSEIWWIGLCMTEGLRLAVCKLLKRPMKNNKDASAKSGWVCVCVCTRAVRAHHCAAQHPLVGRENGLSCSPKVIITKFLKLSYGHHKRKWYLHVRIRWTLFILREWHSAQCSTSVSADCKHTHSHINTHLVVLNRIIYIILYSLIKYCECVRYFLHATSIKKVPKGVRWQI